MKRLISTSAALVLAAVLTPAAQAENTTGGAGASIACGFGSCFVPRFTFVGQVNTYTGPGTAGNVRVEFADCCAAGDRYRVSVLGQSTADVTFTSRAPLTNTCSVGPYRDSRAVEIRGARTIRYKALALPGGIPADAYLRIRQAGWIKNPAVDACGF